MDFTSLLSIIFWTCILDLVLIMIGHILYLKHCLREYPDFLKPAGNILTLFFVNKPIMLRELISPTHKKDAIYMKNIMVLRAVIAYFILTFTILMTVFVKDINLLRMMF